MDSKQLIKLSKFLSLVLRHKPAVIGLKLDRYGWAKVVDLITAMRDYGHFIDVAMLNELVENNDKQRFSFSEDSLKIRANQGHSIYVDLELEPAKPPEYLYHGTAKKNLGLIYSKGLLPGERQYVHLTEEMKTAEMVGKRHGESIILKIKTLDMFNDGFKFLLSKNGVWLSDEVPAEYIETFNKR